MVKCQHCNEQGDKSQMKCESKDTGELLKSGKPKLINKYYHLTCYDDYLQDKEFKQQELIELDYLYQYLLGVHNIKSLDGRMMEKIQDLRNGTVKMGNKKVNRYKNGVSYTLMLDSYKFSASNIDEAIKNMQFDKKWNEFAYCFAIMNSNIPNVEKAQKFTQERKEIEANRQVEVVEIKVDKKKKVKDDMDLSDFL